MKKNPFKIDAKETALFERELEHIQARIYEVPRKPNKALDILPVTSNADMEDETITWREWDGDGEAQFIQDYATDFPLADAYATERSSKVYTIGAGYQISIMELRQSIKTGKKLDMRRAKEARDAIELKMNKLAWNGDADRNIPSFIDYPGTLEYTVPNGAAASKTFASKTPDEILADLFAMETTIIVATNEVESPTVLLVPIEIDRIISTTRMTDGDRNVIKKFFLENSKTIKRIETVPELATAGAGSTKRMIAFEDSEEKLSFEVPLMLMQMEPQKKGQAWITDMMARVAGLIVYRPLSICIADGI